MQTCTITSDREQFANSLLARLDVVSISQQLRLCVWSSLLCQRLNYSLGVCLQALGPRWVGLMPAMLGLVCLVVWTDPQPQPRAQHRPTSCCKHLRHHTAASVPVCINTRARVHACATCIYEYMPNRSTKQDICIGLHYSGHNQETFFMRLPTADSLDEFMHLCFIQLF